MKRTLLAVATAGVVVAVAAVLTARRLGPGASAAEPPDSARPAVLDRADLARAARADLIEGVAVSGTLKPVVDIRIASPLPEVVEQVLVREGQAVRRGDTLARLRVEALEPAAASAEVQRRKAASDYDRMRNLYQEGAISQSDVEAAEVALRAAEAAESRARKQLDEATIRASVDGVVSERHVEAGDRVKDGDQLFRLVNTSRLEFEATVPSELAPRVRPGAVVLLEVSGAADSGDVVHGTVARVNATVDAATRQVKLYVTVLNPGGRLVGGQFASGRVVLRRVAGAIAVPLAALRNDSAGARYVLLVDRGRIARAPVATGATDERALLVEIRRGLVEGATVIIGPANGLTPGQVVSEHSAS